MARKTRRRKISQEEREARARAKQRQRMIWIGAGVLVAALLGAGLVWLANRPEPGEFLPSLGNNHIEEGQRFTDYNSTPPTSGPHYGAIAPWGISSEPIPNERQVHNLEDGGVMVQYNCPDGCDDLVEQLSAIVRRYDDHVILAPYPDMESRIALTAWQRIDLLEEFDEGRILSFINAYRGIDHHR